MKEVSPRPWKVAQPWAGFSEIRSADGKLVFGLAVGNNDERQPAEVCEANAKMLELAVNAHDALVAALKDIEWSDGDMDGDKSCPSCCAKEHDPARNRFLSHEDDCQIAAALRLAGEL